MLSLKLTAIQWPLVDTSSSLLKVVSSISGAYTGRNERWFVLLIGNIAVLLVTLRLLCRAPSPTRY